MEAVKRIPELELKSSGKSEFSPVRSVTFKKKRNKLDCSSAKELIYNWETSIPTKWKKIKGEKYFVSIKKTSRPKNTMEFIAETQKYIDNISNPYKNSLNSQVIKKRTMSLSNKEPQKEPRPLKTTQQKQNPVPKQTTKLTSETKIQQSKPNLLKNSILDSANLQTSKTHHSLSKFHEPRNSVKLKDFAFVKKDREEQTDTTSTQNYLINKYSFPKGLQCLRRSNTITKSKLIPPIQEFITRFDHKTKKATPPVIKKGLNGWKLTSKRTTKQESKPQVLNDFLVYSMPKKHN